MTLANYDRFYLAEAQDLAQHPALVYLAGLGPGSRRSQAAALGTMAALLLGFDPASLRGPERRKLALAVDWSQVRPGHTALIRAALAEHYSVATVNRHLAALRGVLAAAWRLGLLTGETYHQAAALGNLSGEPLPAGRAITPGELTALMSACVNDPSPKGARDGAILALLYVCGLRRGELVSLDLADYDPAQGEIRIQAGKGRKARTIPLVDEGGLSALEAWLAARGPDPGPLFIPIRRGGHLQPGRLSRQGVYKLVLERAGQAGVNHLTPHDFRRTFIGDLLDAGADIATVARLAGHANIETTRRYDRRPEAAKRKAAALLHVPYPRRQLPG